MNEHNMRYLHCKQCFDNKEYHQIEVMIDPDGLWVICTIHGPMFFFDPEILEDAISNIPPCECCSNPKPN